MNNLTNTGKLVLVGAFILVSVVFLAVHDDPPVPVVVPVPPAEMSSALAYADVGPIVTVYDRAALRLWSLESSCGRDESWRTTWPERGEFQTTPIWEEDFRDIFGREPRWDDPVAMLSEDVPSWLWFRAHSYRLPTPHTVERLVELYQKGH